MLDKPCILSLFLNLFNKTNNRVRKEMGKQNFMTFPGLFQDFFSFFKDSKFPNFV